MKINKNTIMKIGLGIAVLLIMGFFFYLFKNFDLTRAKNNFENRKLITILFIWLIYILKPFLFFLPTSLQLAFTSILFPWYIALIINAIGIALEMASGYYIGMYFGKDFANKILQKSKMAQNISNKYLKENFDSIFITHFVPIFPFDVFSMLYGASSYGLIKYLIPSVIGLAPRIVAFTISGAYINDPLSIQFILPLVVIGAISLIATRFFNKKHKDVK